MFFARDMLQERSAGFDAKLQAKDSLMNSGLVCALLLTMVVSALQADAPTPEPTTILSMYYTVSQYVSAWRQPPLPFIRSFARASHVYFQPPFQSVDEPLLLYVCHRHLGDVPSVHCPSG